MKKIIFFILFACIACSTKEVIIPEGILKKNEMQVILRDIHLAQANMNNKMRNDSVPYTLNDYLDLILRQHHTDRPVFMNSLKFYSDNTEILQEVYDSVITGLSRMQDL